MNLDASAYEGVGIVMMMDLAARFDGITMVAHFSFQLPASHLHLYSIRVSLATVMLSLLKTSLSHQFCYAFH
jgi:hypothetical protein